MSPRTLASYAFTFLKWLVIGVIGIIVIFTLLGVLFPFPSQPGNMAKKNAAKNDVTQIAQAITAFEAEYGYLPGSMTATNGIVGADLLGILTNNNPQKILFLDAPNAKKGRSGIDTNTGQYIDPWGTPYRIAMNSQGLTNNPAAYCNGTIGASAGSLGSKHVAVWSVTGPSNTNVNLTVYSW